VEVTSRPLSAAGLCIRLLCRRAEVFGPVRAPLLGRDREAGYSRW
jgi:hypothetical protein